MCITRKDLMQISIVIGQTDLTSVFLLGTNQCCVVLHRTSWKRRVTAVLLFVFKLIHPSISGSRFFLVTGVGWNLTAHNRSYLFN